MANNLLQKKIIRKGAKGSFNVPRDFSAEGKRFAQSVVDNLQQLTGEKGDDLDRAVTFNDLINAGIAKKQFILTGGGSNVIIGKGDEEGVETPTAPTGSSASGAFQNILISWDYPSYAGHSHTEIFVSTTDNFASVEISKGRLSPKFLGQTTASVFTHQVSAGSTRFYFIRHVNRNDVAGPAQGTSGLSATTALINTSEIADDLITAAKIVDGAVSTVKIATDAVTNAKIAVDAIQGDVIAAGAITTTKIGADAITSAKIANDAVTADIIAAGAITTTKIADDAISTAKIAANAITASEIAAGSITSNEIAANTITAGDIAAGAINTDELAADAITAAKIAANAITASEIAAGAITATEIATNAITSDKIQANAVTASEIAANSVTASEMVAGTITAASGIIGDAAILSAKIADGAIINAKIADAAIDNAKIASLDASKINAGFINADRIQIDDVTLDTDGQGRLILGNFDAFSHVNTGSVGFIGGTSGQNESDNGQSISFTEIQRTSYGANGFPKHIAGEASTSANPAISQGDVVGDQGSAVPVFSFNFTTAAYSGNRDFLIMTGVDFTGSSSSNSECVFAVAMKATTSATDFRSTTNSHYVFTDKITSSGSHSLGVHNLNAKVSLPGNTEHYIWCFAIGDDGVSSYKSGFINVLGLNK